MSPNCSNKDLHSNSLQSLGIWPTNILIAFGSGSRLLLTLDDETPLPVADDNPWTGDGEEVNEWLDSEVLIFPKNKINMNKSKLKLS